MWNSRWLLLWDITQWQFNDFINGPCSSALGILEHSGSTVGGRVGVISHSQITENRLGAFLSWTTKLSHRHSPPHTNTHITWRQILDHRLHTHVEPYCNVGKCQCKLLKFWFWVGLFLSHCKHFDYSHHGTDGSFIVMYEML